MDKAVSNLAAAENADLKARSFASIANSHGVQKGKTIIKEIFKNANNQYTAAGRKKKLGDVALEAAGDAIISRMVGKAANTANKALDKKALEAKSEREALNYTAAKEGVKAASRLVGNGTTGKIRDEIYKKNNSASRRYNEILKDTTDNRGAAKVTADALRNPKEGAKSLFAQNANEKKEKKREGRS